MHDPAVRDPAIDPDRGCCDRQVGEAHDGQVVVAARILDTDVPAFAISVVAARHEVAAGLEQEISGTRALDAVPGPAEREPFADPAEVDRAPDRQAVTSAGIHHATGCAGPSRVRCASVGDSGAAIAQPIEIIEDARVEPAARHPPCAIRSDERHPQPTRRVHGDARSDRPVGDRYLAVLTEARHGHFGELELLHDCEPRVGRLVRTHRFVTEREPQWRSHGAALESDRPRIIGGRHTQPPDAPVLPLVFGFALVVWITVRLTGGRLTCPGRASAAPPTAWTRSAS